MQNRRAGTGRPVGGKRREAFDDLMDLAAILPWRVCLVLAVVSGLLLHSIATVLSAPNAVSNVADLGGTVARLYAGTLAKLLQFIIPLIFSFGAVAAYRSRSQARSLFATAQASSGDAVAHMTWAQFERLIGETFRRQGYSVTETGGR